MTNIAARKILSTSPVDRLGALNAQIKDLQKSAKILSDEIKGWGEGSHEGDLFSATVANVPGHDSLDGEAMEAKLRELGVDGRWFAKHTKTSKDAVRLTLTDR